MFKKSIIIADRYRSNIELVRGAMADRFLIIEMTSGRELANTLRYYASDILTVICGNNLSDMDAEDLIDIVKNEPVIDDIPVVVIDFGDEDEENETERNPEKRECRALEMGAADYIKMPCDQEILYYRVLNAASSSRQRLTEYLKYASFHDSFTGIYNRDYFLENVEKIMQENMDDEFVFGYLDISEVQLQNMYLVSEEEEEAKTIIRLAEAMQEMTSKYVHFIYGQMEQEVFCFCSEYKEGRIDEIADDIEDAIRDRNIERDVDLSMGLYRVADNTMPAENIYRNAKIAALSIENKYVERYNFYTDELDKQITTVQEITKDMYRAYRENEFTFYLQPKYNMHTNRIVGSEALVRWIHPDKGMISPGDFIPVFERNGFITKLDYLVWELVCQKIREWLDFGIDPMPVSVNVSRIDIQNHDIKDVITALVDSYELPHDLFEIEITESAYMNNPKALIKMVDDLKADGFTVLMDDFGSGYSSLNILKDLNVDILKLDMMFLQDTNNKGRGESIVESIIRMTRWLDIKVIVEGVETEEQVNFLKTIGCDFVQGYYYAKPMEIEEFRHLSEDEEAGRTQAFDRGDFEFDVDQIFEPNPQMKAMFGDLLQPLAIFEYDGSNIEYVRVNKKYYDVFGSDDLSIRSARPIIYVEEEYRNMVLDTFAETVKSHGQTQCYYARKAEDKRTWINLKLRYLTDVGQKHLLIGFLDDVSEQQKMDIELSKFRSRLNLNSKTDNKMPIVDDMKANRAILQKIFGDTYTIFEASNGREAMEMLKEHNDIGIILLDIVMPEMNGWEFLEIKKNDGDIAGIPVIIITAEDKLSDQEQAASLGITDYITKPFVPEIVRKRVNNAVTANIGGIY